MGINHRPQRLSVGEKQRVAIARDLANNSAFILADEPTGNLDSQNKAEIFKLLAKLNLAQGTTIIMVTHDSQAANYTERMLLLKDGKIIKEKKVSTSQKRTTNAQAAKPTSTKRRRMLHLEKTHTLSRGALHKLIQKKINTIYS